MEYQDPIVEFLTREENFRTAFKVAKYVQTITEDLHKQFWPHMHQHMKVVLEASEYSERWSFVPLPKKNVFQQYGKCYLSPKFSQPVDVLYPTVGFGQGTRSNLFRFYQGIRWSKVPKAVPTTPQFAQLKEKLRLLDLTISDNLWPGWNWISYRARGEDFLVRMANEPEKITNEIAEGMWKLFLEFVPLLEAINKQIRDNPQQTDS